MGAVSPEFAATFKDSRFVGFFVMADALSISVISCRHLRRGSVSPLRGAQGAK
jgi:hypothetical protein